MSRFMNKEGKKKIEEEKKQVEMVNNLKHFLNYLQEKDQSQLQPSFPEGHQMPKIRGSSVSSNKSRKSQERPESAQAKPIDPTQIQQETPCFQDARREESEKRQAKINPQTISFSNQQQNQHSFKLQKVQKVVSRDSSVDAGKPHKPKIRLRSNSSSNAERDASQ